MIIGITGHRKLVHSEHAIAKQLILYLTKLKPDKLITGMALGFDQLSARVAVYLHIPFIAAIPAKTQANRWTVGQKKIYEKIIKRAEQIVRVDTIKSYKGRTYTEKLFNRNLWLVDHSDKLIAYYNNTGNGGTLHAMRYAYKQRKVVIGMTIRKD